MTRRAGRPRAAGPLTVALALLLAPGLVSCATAAPRLPPGTQADVKQYRNDYGPRVLQLRVTAGRSGFTVTRLRLTSPSLSSAAVWTGTAEMSAGQTIDFPSSLPGPRCGSDSDPAPRMRIDFRLTDGRTGSATVAATQSVHDLDRIHAIDCTAARISAVAGLRGERVTITGNGSDSVATLHIAVTPTGKPGGFTLVEVRSTVLLAPAGSPATAWPVGMHVSGTDAPSEIPLAIVPTRCDAHVIAEDKVGTLLPVDVLVDGDVPDPATAPSGDPSAGGRFPLPLADGLTPQLLRFVAQHCGIDG